MKNYRHSILVFTFIIMIFPSYVFAKKPASPSAAVNTVTGTILDKDTQEDLGGAYLYFEELQKGIYSGPDGKFNLDGIAPGNYKVTVKFISYHDKKVSVKVMNGKKNFTRILLDPVKP
jgi:hypothetical protein